MQFHVMEKITTKTTTKTHTHTQNHHNHLNQAKIPYEKEFKLIQNRAVKKLKENMEINETKIYIVLTKQTCIRLNPVYQAVSFIDQTWSFKVNSPKKEVQKTA